MDILRARIIYLHNYGFLQLVVDDQISWIIPKSSLDDYLASDKREPMEIGQGLTRYALIEEQGEIKWLVWAAHYALYDG